MPGTLTGWPLYLMWTLHYGIAFPPFFMWWICCSCTACCTICCCKYCKKRRNRQNDQDANESQEPSINAIDEEPTGIPLLERHSSVEI